MQLCVDEVKSPGCFNDDGVQVAASEEERIRLFPDGE